VLVDLWRKLSIYIVIPCLVLASINAWNLWNEHWEHWEHMPPLEERVEYPYQNIRTKNFFWGDGDKVRRVAKPSRKVLTELVDPLLERQGQLPRQGQDDLDSAL